MRDKRAKFIELANQRVSKALEQIRLVGNLANRATYEFSEDDAKKIIKTLQKAVNNTKARFEDGGGAPDRTFRLDER